ncbi:mitochondrial cytochrome c oxidase subunit VIa [Fomitiporia mediterranea MF3/22]|uniref:mitochondrial cytochrome c oxidase subunit VIa n=1 Tax=Fomitiporia mediterranea (strain MF3/22) TaxID=694068 RepID=UPI0004407B85|nr:mitochondrial cytochrome c oxidase subunit VIa [Fomitiporia mediterranea MF3/22]EJD04207.1 mitochondrial cytochrome c oxidase subunit VIa [Fomitiporia mediterranea MF3/22]
MLRLISRPVARFSTRRVPRCSRGFAAHAENTEQFVLEGNPTKQWLEQRKAVEHHAAETTELWRRISFFVAVPATILGTLWVQRVESEHAEHEEHIKAEHGGELPPVPEYDYLNKRAKPFPWGMNSLFYNPHANKDMSGAGEE